MLHLAKGLFPRSGIGKTSQEILIRIQEHVMRDFTYASDALNAFQGVLGAFQSLENPVYHVCGVIIFTPSTFKTTKLLSIGETFAFGLGWSFRGPCSRRTDFPSWSWLGWNPNEASVYSFNIDFHPKDSSRTILAAVSIETAPGVYDDVEKSRWWVLGCEGFPLVVVVKAWVSRLDTANGENFEWPIYAFGGKSSYMRQSVRVRCVVLQRNTATTRGQNGGTT